MNDGNLTLPTTGPSVVYAWGSTSFGRLGTGSLSGVAKRPRRVVGAADEKVPISHVSCAAHQTFMVLSSGACLANGSNVTGCLGGDGTSADEGEEAAVMWPVPRQISSIPVDWKVKQVCCGSELSIGVHTVLLTASGKVFTFGCAKLCGIGPTDEEVIHTPTLVTRFITPWRVAEGRSSVRIVDCSAGGACTAVISSEGAVFTFGALTSGRLGYRRPHSGGNYQLRPKGVRLESPAESVACGAAHMLCVCASGKLWGWGDNSAGQLGQGHLLDEYAPVRIHHTSHGSAWSTAVGACGSSSLAIDRVGRLYVWGQMMIYLGGSSATERFSTVACTFGIRKILFPWAWPRQIRGVEGSGTRVCTAKCMKEAVVFTTSDDVVYEWKPDGRAQLRPERARDVIATDDDESSSDEGNLSQGGVSSAIGRTRMPRQVQFPLAQNLVIACGPEHTVVAGRLGHRALVECGKCLMEGRQLPYADSSLAGIPVHTAVLRHRLSAGAFLGVIQPQLESISHEDDVLLNLVEDFRASASGKGSATGDQSRSTTAGSAPSSRVESLIDSVLGDESDAENLDHFPEIPNTLRLSTLPHSVVVAFVYFLYTDTLPAIGTESDARSRATLLTHIARCLGLPRLLALVDGDDDIGFSTLPKVLAEMFNHPWPEYLNADLPCAPAAIGQSSRTRLKAHMFILAAHGLSPAQFETIPVDFARAILCYVYTERLPSNLGFPTRHWVAFAETVSALGLYSLAAAASDRVMSKLSEDTWATLAIETEGSRACRLVHLTSLGCGVTEAVVHVRRRMTDLGWFTEPEDVSDVEPRVEKLLGSWSAVDEQLGFLRKRRPGLYNELRDSVSRDVKQAVQAELVVMQHVSHYDKLSQGGDNAATASTGPELRASITRCSLELLALLSITGAIVSMIQYATSPEAPVWARRMSDWLLNYEALVLYSGGPTLKMVVNISVAAVTIMYMFNRLST
ncbi:E3 ubiquitin-protein ligase herc2 [Perkinsus olseni]|uniref:E3 ubiquitin-protein ligase herc2 n=1 Tax=Perkinsus olseni TaxID=32597 RepID=A0A7J6RB52_PEROL|nr:E3 ubiquitin-protein ligase herc2 [Perkinsus olseni]